MNINQSKVKLLSGLSIVTLSGLYVLSNSVYTITPGHKGIIFSRLTGIKKDIKSEGWNLRIPYFERPIIFDVKTRPKIIQTQTANRELQNVNLTLRILYRPQEDKLAEIYTELGPTYDEKVLPSITNEVLKSVVARYNAMQLLNQRDQISFLIRQSLGERAKQFHIILDDVSITDLTFGREFSEAIERKQVAQQIAERAKYIVERAKEDKKSTIIKAQGQARSAELIGQAVAGNPAYIDLRRIDTAREIANVLAESKNKVILDSNALLLNLSNLTNSPQNNK
eukprot:TRINITY_DN308_c0_g1_i1.p1 TRINITY_DN308_c0_g1~~TRINITY_DN308_c0_g1_i1.p1  ORF type:complete len:282 (-),score=83.61 TRINITY_DN308_c0_g1_i1:137-982(-)